MPHFATLKNLRLTYTAQIDLFFASSWDIWKGAKQVLELLRQIRHGISGSKFQGILLGGLAQSALELGVIFVPTTTRRNFNRKLTSAKVIID